MFIYRFFKEWRKNPRWSFSCCLALLLPLNDLQQQVLGMTGKNVLTEQLQTGNVDIPSLSGSLKESGAVSIELTIFPEHPEETSGSPSEETETGPKKERNADKGTVITVDEPEKQEMTGKNEVKPQLQTGNVDMPSESGALKKSGTVRIVHASIHEPPKKTRGSLTKEKKAVGKKERNADKVEFDNGEGPEKSRLPKDNLQQEMTKMRGKNLLKQELQTCNVNSPSESGALKKSGTVRIVHASIHEPPKKTRGSLIKEKKAVGKKERNADKVEFDKGEGPEKSRLPKNNLQQEMTKMIGKNLLKQELQTCNVNSPSESGALKKSGTVRIVHASIHEPPKKTRGSLTKEKKAVGKKERNADKVEFDKGEKPEKNSLPQDNLQQEMTEMRGKDLFKQQLQTGNVNTPSASGALKKGRAVKIVHGTIHKRPRKIKGSLTKEKKAVEEKERNADKVAFDKGEEPEKNRLPQDNLQQEIREMRSKNPLKQHLQTGNVNTPSESGVLKKGGAVDFVLVTIHEHPEEACGSLSEERGTGEMKQGDDNRVATNTPEEEMEGTRL